ncbi:MAG: phage portal protein [Planctomycetes bacterium]|nr:phage portal protein [Planctomycetota bacterium]
MPTTLPRSTEHPSQAVDPRLVDVLLEDHAVKCIPRFERLWDYYRNPLQNASPTSTGGGRWYHLGQEQGLPPRITQPPNIAGVSRREVVIENDIAWRVHTLVDFMFAKPVTVQSMAADPKRADAIEAFLGDIFDANGGVSLFQDMALLGSVYGFVDVLVRVGPAESVVSSARGGAERILFDVIEAPRAVPVLNPDDYRRLDAYVLHYHRRLNDVESDGSVAGRLLGLAGRRNTRVRRRSVDRTEVWTGQSVEYSEGPAGDRQTVERVINGLGVLPVVHIQNLPQPFYYEGLSEVEPLIPLQDELNTRLSDRANRVTFQSFKMYLGRGIEGFLEKPVGPGQMWATENPEASILEFGGDAASPSEESHISEIREAMDKASAVTAVAAGLLRNRVGNLSSENAIRIVMMGLLSRTQKKRVTYGAGVARLCELALHAADVHRIFPNRPEERRVRLHWPSPLPDDTTQRLRDGQLKLALGVPAHQVLTELGYGPESGQEG